MKAGQTCERTGCYWCAYCSHELTLLSGDVSPLLCPKCKRETVWVMVRVLPCDLSSPMAA